MAETKTAEALSKEVQKQDYGIYNQGKIKLNYNEDTQEYSEEYEPFEGYKMFIPPPPLEVKTPIDIPSDTPVTDPMPSLPVEPAQPIVTPRDEGESAGERRRRENMERFGSKLRQDLNIRVDTPAVGEDMKIIKYDNEFNM